MCFYHNLFNHSSVVGDFGCFWYLAISCQAPVNYLVYFSGIPERFSAEEELFHQKINAYVIRYFANFPSKKVVPFQLLSAK